MAAPLDSEYDAIIELFEKVWSGFSSFSFGQGRVGGDGCVFHDSVRERVGQAG